MNDYKIVIDAGHGGEDSGAVGNGIIEKDLNLKIANYMYNRFKNLGIPVKIIRSTDETVSPNERVNRVLNAFGNNKDVIVISNHINAGGGDGAEVIYPLRSNDTLPNLILSELEKEGQNIRKAYQRRYPSNPNKDYYFMQRNTGLTEALTVEYGFLDSKKDDVNQLKNNYERYAEAVVRAVLEYIGIEDIAPIDEIYTVKKGDTLYSIANKYGLTVSRLKELNNLDSDILNIGQQLIVKDNNDIISEIEYIVKKGDTLYSISKNYNISLNELMDYNSLTTNILSIGQIIKIPNVTDINSYVVKKGDTLYSIAKKFNKSVNEIKEKNNLPSTLLRIGQILII